MPNYSTTEKVALIKQGKESEHYTEWLNEKDPIVLHVLASHEYFSDYFLNNGTSSIITLILDAHPEYISKIIDSTKPEHISVVQEILINKADATENELLTHIHILTNKLNKDLCDYGAYHEMDHRAEMRMKIAADKVVPTTIEKTMTPLQLYKADNLLWTLPYSGNQVALANHTLRDPLNNLTTEFVFNALDYGVQNSSELVSYALYHQKN